MSVISISSGVSGYSRSEDLRPKQVSMKEQEALASKTLTYDEQEEINKFQDVIDGLSSEDQDAVETYLEEALEKMRKGETDMTALAALPRMLSKRQWKQKALICQASLKT